MEKELIKIQTNEEGKQLVSGRELHEKLKVGRDFTTWIKGRINKYGFIENEDFMITWNDTKTGGVVEFNGNVNSMIKLGFQTDYIITLDMAKELSMIENNDIGREFRKYFIECEKKLKEVVQQPQLTPQEQLALQLFNGGLDAITAHKELLAIETKKLNDTIIQQEEKIEEQIGEIKQLSPLAETLLKRFEKGENIGWKDVTKTFNLKQGQASKWAVENGYIYKNKKDVTNKGDKYFQRYVINGFKNVCITPEGIKLIEEHLEEIKAL